MIDALAALKTGQDFGLLVLPVLRDYEFEDGFADRLFRRIAEQALGSPDSNSSRRRSGPY